MARGPHSYDPEEEFHRLHRRFSRMETPRCTLCRSHDTATAQVGVIRLTLRLAVTCRKFKLVGLGPKPADWYCHDCERFFDLPEDDGEACDVRFQRNVRPQPAGDRGARS